MGIIFIVPWIEGLLVSGNRFSNYATPFMLIAGLFACRSKNKNSQKHYRVQHKIFFAWVCLSLLLGLIVYRQKIKNFLNISSISGIYISAYLFLQKKNWHSFLEAFVCFLISYLFFNILIQICLPRSWGEFIFNTQSGFGAETSNFAYTTITEKICNMTNVGPLAIPAFRNHGLSVLTALLTLYALSRMISFTKTKFTNSNRIVILILFAVGLVLSFLCEARGVLIALAVIFFYCFRYVRNKCLILASILLPLFIIFFTCNQVFFLNKIRNALRIQQTLEETVSGRAELWDLHKKLIIEKPWTGWGASLPYEDKSYDIENKATCESGFSYILATQGLIRGGLFLSLLALGIWQTGYKAVQDWQVLFLHFTCILLFILSATTGMMVNVTSAIDSTTQIIFAIALFCFDKTENETIYQHTVNK